MFSKVLVSALVLATATMAGAPQADASIAKTASASSGRSVVDLSTADWKFQLGGTDDGAAATLFDDSGWQKITLPHTWNNVGAYATTRPASTNNTQGIGWYRLHVRAPLGTKGQRQYLDFAGVGNIADVWVNGVHLGQHRGAYSRFRYDVTAQWKPGADNVVSVKADNSKRSAKSATGEVLPLAGDFFIYGGIYRNVSLVTTGSAAIDMLDYGGPGVYARTVSVSPKGAAISVLTRLRNSGSTSRQLTAMATIADAQGAIVARTTTPVRLAPGANQVTQALNVANPHLWNGLDDPYQYSVSVALMDGRQVVDKVKQPLGIRTFAFDANEGFSLNGHHLQLHGVSRHQDREGKGAALSPQDHLDDMAMIKDMGANTIRLAHYEHADEWVNAADATGMVTWAEVPFVSASSYDGSEGTSATFANAEQQLRELIRQDYNHPSIVTWSVGNEVDAAALYITGGKPAHPLKLLQDLNAVAKAEDPSRPTTFADCCEDSPLSLTMKEQQALAGTADLIGYNRYYGWYYGKATEVGAELDKLHAKHPALPMSVSEYGAGGALSQHSDNPLGGIVTSAGRAQPEEYESWYHEESWKQLKSRKYLFATWVWNMFDFATEMRAEGDSVDINTKGLVAYDHKTKKDAFWFYKANWSKDPVVFLTDKGYSDRAYPVMTIRAYSNAEKVRLTVNGQDKGSAPCPDSICVWDNVSLQPGANSVVAEATINGKPVRDQATWNGPAAANGIHIKAGDIMTRTIGDVRFGSDAFFVGGDAVGFSSSTFTSTWRQGDAFIYRIPIANGHWHVSIQTMDPGRTPATANALISIKANGQLAVPPFNALKSADRKQKVMVTKTFDVDVQDGVLTLDVAGTGGPAVISAIEITR